MSLYFADRVKEQEADDQLNDKKIVFNFPWIINFPIQNEGNLMEEDVITQTYFITSFKMATIPWIVCIKNDYNKIVINNHDLDYFVKNGDCFISYTLYYDAEMRFEYFSSTKIQMEEHGHRENFCTPDGFMARFIKAVNNNVFSLCVLSIELHLPMKYFYQSSFKRKRFVVFAHEISDKLPDDVENDFRFEFSKNGDYTFECLDGTVLAHRDILFLSSATLKQQLSFRHHYPVGVVNYTVDVIKPILIFFHSLCFKLPESFNLDYIARLLSAIEFFEPYQKSDLITKVKQVLGEKFVKEKHNFNSLILWLSFSFKCQYYDSGLVNMICSLIANEHYFKWQQTFPVTARNADNQLYHQLFGQMQIDDIFGYIDFIFGESFVTNIILQ